MERQHTDQHTGQHTDQRTYPAGTSCWIDLETRDAHAVAPFYAALLGWQLTDAMPAEAPGHYLIATSDGEDVGAIASGVAATGTATVWSTYFAVDDADAAASAVRRAGGRVTAEPEDNPGGRAAACVDPQGGAFRLWQAGRRVGSQAVNRPGGWNFSDLHTADRSGAMAFYGAVFGWELVDLGAGAEAMILVPGYGDHLAATSDPGIYERQADAPAGFADVIAAVREPAPGEAPNWHVVFTVADRDEAMATAERLGGTIEGTDESRWSLRARVRDPAGAAFTVSQYQPQG